jgi:competence protein ComEC
MMSVVAAGWTLRRPSDLLNSLAAAACLLLVWDPRQIGDAGFQLSFVVVLSLAVVAPLFMGWGASLLEAEPWLPEDLSHRPSDWLRVRCHRAWMGLSVSVAAWVGSAPLAAFYFQVATPVSIGLNLLVCPLAGLVVLSGICSLICSSWWVWGSECFNASGWLAMRLMMWMSKEAADLPGAWWRVAPPSVIFMLGYFGLVLWGLAGEWPRRTRWLWVGISVSLMILGMLVPSVRQAREVSVTVLPVAGGDAVWLDLPGREKDLLIDAGDSNAAEWLIGPFLNGLGRGDIPRLLLTHGDASHVGGVETLLAGRNVGEVWVSAIHARSSVYRKVLAGLEAEGVSIRRVGHGDEWGELTVLHPKGTDDFNRADDQALVMLLQREGFRVLLCSDLGRQGQMRLLEREPGLRADVVVAGLPSDEGDFLSDTFLGVVRPRVLVVSCGSPARRSAVSRELETRLGRFGCRVVWTRESGGVVLRLGFGRLEIELMDGGGFRLLPACFGSDGSAAGLASE